MHIPTKAKILASITIIAVLYYFLDFGAMTRKISEFNLLLLPLALASLGALFLVSAFNFKMLFDPLEKMDFMKMLKFYIYSWAIGFLTPGRVGDITIVPSISSDSKIKLGSASAIFLLNKAITFSVLILGALIALLLFFSDSVGIFVLAIALALAFAIALFSQAGRELVKKYILMENAKKLEGFYTTFKDYLLNKKVILGKSFGLAVVSWALQTSTAWIILLGLGTEASFLHLYIVVTAVSAIAFLPFTLNGIGPREALFVLLAGKIGIDSQSAGAATAISLSLNTAIFFAISIAIALDKSGLRASTGKFGEK